MDREQEVIHKQMEETRADLTNKLSALEQQVSGTVQAATTAVETTKDAVTGTVEAVTDTVETVKESVENTVGTVKETIQDTVSAVKESVKETVQSVTETFNLRLQAERHPWAVFGGSVVVGALAGYLLGGSRRGRRFRRSADEMRYGSADRPEQHESMLGGAASAVGHAASSTASTLGNVASGAAQAASGAAGSLFGGWLGEQLSGLKGLAVGTVMGVVRDLAKQVVPENIKERVTEEVDKFTRNLGGEPIKGSILPENNDQSEPGQHNDHGQQHQGQYETAGAHY